MHFLSPSHSLNICYPELNMLINRDRLKEVPADLRGQKTGIVCGQEAKGAPPRVPGVPGPQSPGL